MLDEMNLDLKISEEAQRRLTESLAAITEYDPVTVLSLGRLRRERTFRWVVGFHNSRVVEGDGYRGMLVRGSGFELVIPKEHEEFVRSLVGAVIDVREGAFVVVHQDTDEIVTWEPEQRGQGGSDSN
jgi:hypothetical protein